MKYSTRKIRSFLAIFLVSVTSLTFALPTETEYLGNVVHSGYWDDRSWGPLPIGFNFDFFGNTYSNFHVTSNGLVMFGSGTTQWTNSTIPTSGGANNYIAPFWDDLIIHNTGDIMYQTIGTAPNRKLVVQYTNMSFWSSTVLLGTIQVILYEGSNNIQMQYRSIVDLSSNRASGTSATIGLENINGSAGVLCSYNTAGYIQSEKAILFTPGGGTYTYDDNAIYDGVLLVDAIPRSGTPTLVSPAYNSTVGDTVTFQWEAASNASSYYVVISQNSDLSSPIHTSADLTDLSYEYILSPDQTYYWSAYSKNSEGTVSWSEIWQFQTSSTPPLVAVPQTMYLEQGDQRALTLLFTGGDAGSKTATVTSLPGEGTLYQDNGGIPGAQISTVPTDVSDASFGLIYSASGAAGNGAGDFDFHFTDVTGTSPDETYTINVSPPGIPNFLYASKEIDRVEISFDRNMSDPTGKHLEFAVEDNGVPVTSTACELKTGDPTTIVVYVSPNLDTDHAIGVAYTRGTVTAESSGILESFDFQLAGKLAQVINFSALIDRTYGEADYTLSATASSGLPVTFSSSNSTVVSVTGTTASVNNAGEALIYATQAGNATYAAVTFERHQQVNKATATVSLSDLSQEYTGSGIAATIATVPVGLNLKVTYDGLATLPVDIGTYTVLAEVEEANYEGSATDDLVITDLTPPVPDLPSLPDLSAECSLTPVAPGATDLYAGAIVGTTTTSFPVTTQGTTVVTWSYDDGNGNTSIQLQNVILDDVSDPVTPTLDDATEECSIIVDVPTTTDNCAGVINGTTSDPLTYTTQGTFVITWTFDDGNGNSISVPQNMILADASDPVPDLPSLPDIVAQCEVTALTPPTATDNCAGTVTATHNATLPITAQGTTLVTWTYDDGNGNAIAQDQNVVLTDVSGPVPDVDPLPDVSAECEVTSLTAPTATDNCVGGVTGTHNATLPITAQGSTVVTWTYDDGNGNTSTQLQNVIVDDISAPVPDLALADINAECEVTTLAIPTATDNCVGPVTGTHDASLPITAQGTTVVTWTYDDGNGNTSTQLQNVILDDISAPVPDLASLPDISTDCEVTILTAPTASDNCVGTVTGTHDASLPITAQGTNIVTWTYDDGNGNTSTQLQNMILDDISAPVPDLASLPDISTECEVTSLAAPTATDNCAGSIAGTHDASLPITAQGTTLVTWTYDDGNGNTSTQLQNVILDDLTDPVTPTLADVRGECSATAVAPTTTDNCAGTLTGTTGDPLSYTTQGTFVITWTFDDGHGNSIDVVQNVIVADLTDPTATAPTDLVSCDGTVSSIGLTDVSDNCTTPTVSFELSGATTGSGSGDASDQVFAPGVTTVTYTLDDGNGNSSQYQFTVDYQLVDDIVVTVDAGTLTCETTGSYQWISCDGNTIIDGETASTFTPALSGEYAVILTQGACSDTSDCYSVTASGLGSDKLIQTYKVYPNPAHNYATIDMANEQTNVTLKVFDMTGNLLQVEEMDRLTKMNLDITEYKAGIYMIQIHSDQLHSVARLIKE